jgi:hypothetical protein
LKARCHQGNQALVGQWLVQASESSISPIASYSQLEERTPQPLLNRMV